MLVKTKGTCSDELRIDGTRLTYRNVIEILKNMTIFEAIKQYPTLKLEGIIDCLIEFKSRKRKKK